MRGRSPASSLALICGSIAFIVFILYLFSANTKVTIPTGARLPQLFAKTLEEKNAELEDKVQELEQQVGTNEERIKDLRAELDNLKDSLDKGVGQVENKKDDEDTGGNKVQVVNRVLNKVKETFGFSSEKGSSLPTCPAKDIPYHADGDIQMLSAYDIIPFDNVKGGKWTQGFEITYDAEKIKQGKPLEVVVVPHSHNDPGWWYTFEGYFQMYTNSILDLMQRHLKEKPDMSFIYAESCFLELWWSKQSEETRKNVINLLEKGQFEVVTGAWVMTDEANSHWYATVMQMIEGHEFLSNHMNFNPKNHWSIDPFGLSPTMAYLLKESNLTHMVIHRTHYSVKKYLAQKKNLEFMWRQLWAGSSKKTDIHTHMFPFNSYDIAKTCGPDPGVCCQFDFRKIGSSGCSEWGSSAVLIDAQNIHEKAKLLSDQYRKKAQLFKTNVVLVPHGDDFRWPIDSEWRDQYQYLKMLFQYMNNNTEWNIHARFGTLKEYFSLVEQDLASKSSSDDKLPTLSGDFFTYADRDDHYWSGYYTSRPFYKHMDRTLQHYLRTADILYSLWQWKVKETGPFEGEGLYDQLVQARRNLGVFQHHDGVTGTAKNDVVVDYARKMLSAIESCKTIIQKATNYFMKSPSYAKIHEKHYEDRLPDPVVASQTEKSVIIFNPLPYPREEVICIHVNSINLGISTPKNEEIMQQISPVLNLDGGNFVANEYELCFLAKLPPLGYQTFNLDEKNGGKIQKVTVFMQKLENKVKDFDVKTLEQNGDIELKNDFLTAKVDAKTGFLKKVQEKDGEEEKIDLGFVTYGARGRNQSRDNTFGPDSLSGAYLFLPDGPAKPMPTDQNEVIFIDGPLRKMVIVKGQQNIKLMHKVYLDVNSQSVGLKNYVDLRSTHNFEVGMRMKTSVQNENFFTDLNGYQMTRRKRFKKLPIQAHFYPMPGSAFIEDDKTRISLLGRQALGVASLEPGWMEVILDRHLDQDDDRGLQLAIGDNKRTQSEFKLLIETLAEKPQSENPDSTIAYHSLAAHHISLALHYQPVILFGAEAQGEAQNSISFLSQPLPCDVHLLALRTSSQPTEYGKDKKTKPRPEAALILHRLGVECKSKKELLVKCQNSDDGKLQISKMFTQAPQKAINTSLTLMYSGNEISELKLEPMEVKTVKLVF